MLTLSTEYLITTISAEFSGDYRFSYELWWMSDARKMGRMNISKLKGVLIV